MTSSFNELPVPYLFQSVAFIQLATKFGSNHHLLSGRENIINTDIQSLIKDKLNIFSSTEYE